MVLTVTERMNFGYLLPVQGNLKALVLIEQIADKVRVENKNDGEMEIVFDKEEMAFIVMCVNTLDTNNKLPFACLSLIRKIQGEII